MSGRGGDLLHRRRQGQITKIIGVAPSTVAAIDGTTHHS